MGKPKIRVKILHNAKKEKKKSFKMPICSKTLETSWKPKISMNGLNRFSSSTKNARISLVDSCLQ